MKQNLMQIGKTSSQAEHMIKITKWPVNWHSHGTKQTAIEATITC